MDILNKSLTEDDLKIHGSTSSLDLLVISYSNYKDQFTEEFERSLNQNGIPYILAGYGEKWIDFRNRTTKMFKLLSYYSKVYPNLLVICCDCNDLLFLQDKNEIIKRYYELTQEEKIVVIGEQFCSPGYSPVKECTQKTVKKNKYYPNGGFIMGNIIKLIPLYEYLMTKVDDQIALGEYVSNHCDDFVIDYDNTLVLLDTSFPFGTKVNIILKNGRLYDTISDKYPCAIHILGLSFNPKKRSEHYRNLLFTDRVPIPKEKYDNMFKKRFKISKAEIIIIILLLLLLTTGIIYYFSKKISLFYFLIFFILFIYSITYIV